MALYEGELGAAFKFGEVMDRIAMIGWGKYLAWYIIMVLLGAVAGGIAVLTMMIIIGFILAPLIIYPYFSMFGARSLALLFASSEEGQEPA
jgi:ABC-type multidrug transport system permease subunit